MWVRRFICFYNVRHPAEMGRPEVNAFLSCLAMGKKINQDALVVEQAVALGAGGPALRGALEHRGHGLPLAGALRAVRRRCRAFDEGST